MINHFKEDKVDEGQYDTEVEEFCIVKLDIDSDDDFDYKELQCLEDSNILILKDKHAFCSSDDLKINHKIRGKVRRKRRKICSYEPFIVSRERNIVCSVNVEECVIAVWDSTDGPQQKVFKLMSSVSGAINCIKNEDLMSFQPEIVLTLDSCVVFENKEKPLLLCPDCDYSTRNSDHLKRHYLRHTGEMPFSCPFCTFRSRHKGGLDYHVKTHTGEKNFKCPFCEYACIRKISLRDHIRTHTGIKPYACTLCDYRGTRKRDLKNHMACHTGEKKFSCSDCLYVSGRQNDLYKHIQYKHREKCFFCHLCSYATTQKCDLAKHTLVHSGLKTLGCSFCKYRTSRKSDLNKHLKIHSDTRPYRCPSCPYASKRAGDLGKHIQTHTGFKKFGCDICSFRSVQRSDILKHMRVHKGSKGHYPVAFGRKHEYSIPDVNCDEVTVKNEPEDVEVQPMDDDGNVSF